MIINLVQGHAERLDPYRFVVGGEDGYFGNATHVQRYQFAATFVAGRSHVVDAACGTGYGTKILAARAAHVCGVDLSADAIEYATSHYPCPNVRYAQGDATALQVFDDRSVDVFVSFETLEHLQEPDALVREARRLLRADGVFVVSTPFRDRTCRNPGNQFHTVEFDRRDFVGLLSAHFGQVESFLQYRCESAFVSLLRRLDVLHLRGLLRGRRDRGKEPLAAEESTDVRRLEAALSQLRIARRPLSPHRYAILAVCRSPRSE